VVNQSLTLAVSIALTPMDETTKVLSTDVFCNQKLHLAAIAAVCWNVRA